MRHAEPGLRSDSVGREDHVLDRHATEPASRAGLRGTIAGERPVHPLLQVAVVGARSVHETKHGKPLEVLDPERVEGRIGEACSPLEARIHDLDVAHGIRGVRVHPSRQKKVILYWCFLLLLLRRS